MSNRDKHLSEKGLKYACTDLGNAERFTTQHGDKLRYIAEEGRWVAWDGSRWKHSDKRVHTMATDTIKRIYDEARDCDNETGRAELRKWAGRSESKSSVMAMKDMAAKELTTSITEFDSDPKVINCLNGVVNLETGELEKHDKQLVMKRASVDYRPDAKCPTWQAFLDGVFQQDAELIGYFQKLMGYSLTGLTQEQKVFLAYGLGANGKTTLFETMHTILGDYATTTEFTTFLNSASKNASARSLEEIGKLRGARLAVASETSNTARWSESVVKKASGGDTLRGARMYGSSYEFDPTHKLFFQCNHKPGAKDASHGFWRRMVVIPFKARFEGAAIDPDMRRKLLQERDGIFAWCVAGAMAYFRDGLGELPEACRKETDRYRDDNDVLSRFVDERLQRDAGTLVPIGVKDAHNAYQVWCIQNNEQPGFLKHFSDAMAERGIESVRKSQGMVFPGWTFKDGRPSAASTSLRSANDNPTPAEPEHPSLRQPYDDWYAQPSKVQPKQVHPVSGAAAIKHLLD